MELFQSASSMTQALLPFSVAFICPWDLVLMMRESDHCTSPGYKDFHLGYGGSGGRICPIIGRLLLSSVHLTSVCPCLLLTVVRGQLCTAVLFPSVCPKSAVSVWECLREWVSGVKCFAVFYFIYLFIFTILRPELCSGQSMCEDYISWSVNHPFRVWWILALSSWSIPINYRSEKNTFFE